MTGIDEVDRLLAVITVDCHNLAEEVTAFYETFTEEVPLPATATAGGRSLQVVRFYIDERGYDLAARCRDDDVIHDRRLTDLVFAPDTEAGWIHAAYRRCLGLVPYPATIPQGWQPSWI